MLDAMIEKRKRQIGHCAMDPQCYFAQLDPEGVLVDPIDAGA
jgi:hypothetical protein